jgi:2,5-furandicarboxylate decarboxylase 1
LSKAEKMNKPLEFAIASGVDPLTFLAAIFYAPEGVDKFEIAGGFAEAPIDLVKCRSVDVEVPADAEFILEGYITPGIREKEGPFGESSGYYLPYDNPVGKIKVITHRSRPIYHGLMPFTPEESVLMEIMMTPYLRETIEKALPEVKVKTLSLWGVGEICVVQIEKRREEYPPKIIDYLLSNPFIKIAAVTDVDVDISDMWEIAWALATRVRPDKDIAIKSDLPGSMIDPSVRGLETAELAIMIGKTAKIGINATKPLKELERFEKIGVPAKVEEKILRLLEVLK